MNNTLIDFTVIFSSVLGVFIGISLVRSPFYKCRANKYLSISLFILTVITLLGWYDSEIAIVELLQSLMWEFLIAVTLFTYFLIQIEHRFNKERWYKWLYLPFIITLIAEVCLHLYFNFTPYDPSLNEGSFGVQLFYDFEEICALLFNIVLMLWSRYLIKRADAISKEKKRWLLRLNLFLIILIVIWLLSDFGDNFSDSGIYTEILWISLSFLSWWILYYGVFKLQLVSQKDEIHKYLISQKATKPQVKTKKNEAAISKIIAQLYRLMDEEEIYKNPLLSRADLAKRLGITEGNLSQILNQEINKSVIQVVNEYRIDTAKQLLHDATFHKYAVDAIGMEAGFKSKSAFYRTFKSATGMSPGVYRNLQRKS